MAVEMRAAMMLMISGLVAIGSGGCGSATHPGVTGSSTTGPATISATKSAAGSQGVGALSAEAQSTATGDIPDNQVFLTFGNMASGYSVSYPEGWARKGGGRDVTFSDKNNIVHIVIVKGPAPTPAGVLSELTSLHRADPTLKFSSPRPVTVKSGAAIKTTYTTESAPNPVTGKRVRLIVDRYELARAGQRATIDLGTPRGVDNVDAYRLMINSFRWS